MDTPSKTADHEPNDTLHSMVKNNSLKIVGMVTRRYQIHKRSSARLLEVTDISIKHRKRHL